MVWKNKFLHPRLHLSGRKDCLPSVAVCHEPSSTSMSRPLSPTQLSQNPRGSDLSPSHHLQRLSRSHQSHRSHTSATSATSYFEMPASLPADVVLGLAKSTAGEGNIPGVGGSILIDFLRNGIIDHSIIF